MVANYQNILAFTPIFCYKANIQTHLAFDDAIY